MADLSMVDIEQVVYALRSGSSRLKKTALTRGGNHCGPCPKCHGNDRFYVLPEALDSAGNRRGKWACRNCHPREADAVELLCFMEDITEAQAFARLRELYPEFSSVRASRPAPAPKDIKNYFVRALAENASAPGAQWQAHGKKVQAAARNKLQEEETGAQARAYCERRGLAQETIERYGIGFIPANEKDGTDIEDEAASWGLEERGDYIKLRAGLLFPYFYKGELWKLRVRRAGDVPPEERYRIVPGSANGLYNADSIAPGAPVVIVEGEIDALSIAQATGGQLAAVALGSVAAARVPLWTMRLALASEVLLCLDNGEPDKIADALAYWTARLPHARVLALPGEFHDANDMLVRGGDIPAWLSGEGIVFARPVREATTPEVVAMPSVSEDVYNVNTLDAGQQLAERARGLADFSGLACQIGEPFPTSQLEEMKKRSAEEWRKRALQCIPRWRPE